MRIQDFPYGRQPALKVMARQRWTVAAAAREIGIEYYVFYNMVNGRTVPSPHVRNALTTLLETPLEFLFTAEVLSERYRHHRPYKSSPSETMGKK